MSGAFVRKWTDDQREAMISARLDRGMTFRRVVELANAGALTAPDGSRLEPFNPPISTIASLVRGAKRRRMGEQVSSVAQLPPRDAVETLRRRLINMADAEIAHDEKRKDGTRDPERLRQFGRALNELQRVPGPNEPRRPAPGEKANGTQNGGQTRGGMAGALLAAHRKGEQGPTAQDDAHNGNGGTEKGDAAQRSAPDDGAGQGHEDNRPGSVARANAAHALSPA